MATASSATRSWRQKNRLDVFRNRRRKYVTLAIESDRTQDDQKVKRPPTVGARLLSKL
jgi:hypothetical protein